MDVVSVVVSCAPLAATRIPFSPNGEETADKMGVLVGPTRWIDVLVRS